MRKSLIVAVLILLASGSVFAQGFIPDAEKKQREDQIMALAQQLLNAKKGNAPDTHRRTQLRQQMISLDAIKETDGRVRGDGFAVPAFKWLYDQGQKQNDVNARLQAVIGLEAITNADANAPLLKALDDPSLAVQCRVLGAIRKKNITGAWKQVLPKLSSPSRVIVAEAARTLAALGQDPEKRVGSVLLKTLEDAFTKLQNTPNQQAAERQELEHLVEVLGESMAKLTHGAWPRAQTLGDLKQAIADLAKAYNS